MINHTGVLTLFLLVLLPVTVVLTWLHPDRWDSAYLVLAAVSFYALGRLHEKDAKP